MKNLDNGLLVHNSLADLAAEMTTGTGISTEQFWAGLANAARKLGPKNRSLLDERQRLQSLIDDWLTIWNATDTQFDNASFVQFLKGIGYIVPKGEPFTVTTSGVDPEIAVINGPQLVAPIGNSRLATKATERWSSLFDALGGSDVIPEEEGCERSSKYNPKRGERVIAYVDTKVLDAHFPLVGKFSHAEVTAYENRNDQLTAKVGSEFVSLQNPAQFVGYTKNKVGALNSILLVHNGIHLELRIDRQNPIGKQHHAGVCDVIVESVITFIADFEDANCAVDGLDKATSYRNWWELLKGTLSVSIETAQGTIKRGMVPDRKYIAPNGSLLTLSGRALTLVRNVGIHLYTDAVTVDGNPIPEGFLDCWFTVLAGLQDILGKYQNSKNGKIYIVKPKLQGPEEVSATVELFELAEQTFDLKKGTLLIGVMDEEERTSCNLYECMRAAKDRIIFINTGFLDRTAGKIHFAMRAGPMLPKAQIKTAKWMLTYEDANVDTGLAASLNRVGQIGKGMWAMTDLMNAMMEAKIGHPRAGGNCAWCPSPTAAALHALHYWQVNVDQVQASLIAREPTSLEDLLSLPLLSQKLSTEQIEAEVRNNIQGILGYIARWVGLGIGCSKVPDLKGVNLMEDLATLRISSQHIANWVLHKLISWERVVEIFKEMAAVVDKQNARTEGYERMSDSFNHESFLAAVALVASGVEEPSGLTERVLRTGRQAVKKRLLLAA